MNGFKVAVAGPDQQLIIENLLQEYLSELSAFDNIQHDADGRYEYPYLQFYWQVPDRVPLLAITGDGDDTGEPGSQPNFGFALVRNVNPGDGSPTFWEMAEFYIAPGFRRDGMGSALARYIWNHYPGRWQLRVLEQNLPALAFWRRLIVTEDGNACERLIDGYYTFDFCVSR